MTLQIQEKRNPKTGKPITIISDIIHNPQVIERLSKKIKGACGAGGFIDGKTIIIQGSHTQKIKKLLEKEGFEIRLK